MTHNPKPAEVPTVRTRLQVCKCRYQQEKNWGYSIHKYVGGRKYWRGIGHTTSLETAEAIIASLPVALVRCNGCGGELLREHPARAAIKSATGEAK